MHIQLSDRCIIYLHTVTAWNCTMLVIYTHRLRMGHLNYIYYSGISSRAFSLTLEGACSYPNWVRLLELLELFMYQLWDRVCASFDVLFIALIQWTFPIGTCTGGVVTSHMEGVINQLISASSRLSKNSLSCIHILAPSFTPCRCVQLLKLKVRTLFQHSFVTVYAALHSVYWHNIYLAGILFSNE